MNSPRLTALLILQFAFLALAVAAERILIPVAYTGPGVDNVKWGSRTGYLNLSDADIPWPGVRLDYPCGIPEGCYSEGLRAGRTGYSYGGSASKGIVVTLPPGAETVAVWTQIRAYPSDGPGFPYSMKIPAVRESEFSHAPVLLLEVNSSEFSPARAMLRIYALPEATAPSVRVAITHLDNLSIRETFEVALEKAQYPWASPDAAPWFAAVAGPSLTALDVENPINIEITSLPNEAGTVSPIWAFSSTVEADLTAHQVVLPHKGHR